MGNFDLFLKVHLSLNAKIAVRILEFCNITAKIPVLDLFAFLLPSA